MHIEQPVCDRLVEAECRNDRDLASYQFSDMGPIGVDHHIRSADDLFEDIAADGFSVQ